MIEIDLRKAYDTVSGEFIDEMLTAMKFSGKFIQRAMMCVPIPMFTLLINEVICGFFFFKEGVKTR